LVVAAPRIEMAVAATRQIAGGDGGVIEFGSHHLPEVVTGQADEVDVGSVAVLFTREPVAKIVVEALFTVVLAVVVHGARSLGEVAVAAVLTSVVEVAGDPHHVVAGS